MNRASKLQNISETGEPDGCNRCYNMKFIGIINDLSPADSLKIDAPVKKFTTFVD